jgi:hypothetical protein
MKKPERVKQRFAKTVHIVSAMTLGLLAHGLFHWLGGPAWDSWTNWPINILVGVYCMAILFSKTPVPLSRAANEDMQEYKAWCREMMKQPSQKEYLSDSWKNNDAYFKSKEIINTLTAKGFTDDEILGFANYDEMVTATKGPDRRPLVETMISTLRAKGLTDEQIIRAAKGEVGSSNLRENCVYKEIIKRLEKTQSRGNRKDHSGELG